MSLYFDFSGFHGKGTFQTINSKGNSSNDLQVCGKGNEFSLEMFVLKYWTSK